jgi:DNA polymerase-3 subunit gamma/tau
MARNKRLHVEMALIKMTYINRAVKLASLPNPSSDVSAEKSSSPQTEKKTPDSNGSLAKKEKKAVKEIAVAEVREELPNFNVKKEVSTSEQIKPKPNPEAVSVSTSHDTPRLVDLSDLEEEFENETHEPSDSGMEISLEKFHETWTEYAENIKSPSVRTTISKATFEILDDTIRITVGSTMAKEMVLQEMELMQFLRDQLGRQDLIMEVLIDPDKLPEEAKIKPKKLLSTKEKYDLMRKENPLIDDMRKRFDLKPDYD